MARNRNRKEDENKNGSPAWMTTFGDLMTLLLVFFVLLYSFSVMDIEKFQGFISSFQNQLGVLDGGTTISDENLIHRGSIGTNFSPSIQNFNRIMGEMSSYVQEEGLSDQVELELTERGLVVRLTGTILYDIGKAELRPEGKNLLDEIAGLIIDIPNNIMVEGHTDNWPINTDQFPSNWELSTARATNVVKYFMEHTALEPRRLMAAGYSEYRPLYDNDTVEHRSRNRRVEIVILNTLHDDFSERR